jgi:hypothetical protein
VKNGEVVERVQPIPGDYEDTRLGLFALDGKGGWRVADEQPPTDATSAGQQDTSPPPAESRPRGK